MLQWLVLWRGLGKGRGCPVFVESWYFGGLAQIDMVNVLAERRK